MELVYGKQINSIESEIDLFIGTSNHESRSFTLYDNVKNKILNPAVFLCYKKEGINEKLKNIDFRVINIFNEVNDLLNEKLDLLVSYNKTPVVLIDYSCMTKPWYFAIMLFFKFNENRLSQVRLIFSYTPSVFNKPKTPKYNRYIGPLAGKVIIPNDKPKALIVCLGYEQNKAEGIIEHLEPKNKILFFTDPAIDERYVSVLKVNNKTLLKDSEGSIVTYRYNDLMSLERKLTLTYNEFKKKFTVIIAPLGSKPFTLMAMLMSVKFNDIDIWGVDSGSDINEYDGVPDLKNGFIICETLFQND